MKVNPYLNFNGNCEEAFKSYERILDGKIAAIHRFAGTPAEVHVPPESKNQIMHAAFEFEGGVLMGSDAPGMYEKPQGNAVALHLDDTSRAESIFNALAQGGNVTMPFEETFWAKRFGMCVDRFGTPWMINVPKPM